MLENVVKLSNILGTCKQPEYRFNVDQPDVRSHIAANIRSLVQTAAKPSGCVVVLCIGTDRSTGDSLGPLTGSKLHALTQRTQVFGTLENPVHATNLRDILQKINRDYDHPFIIAVDACLGRLESVGSVSLGSGSVKPGTAVKKELPPVGNAYITGVVNVGGFMEHWVLQSTRLHLVMKMADVIAHGLSFGLRD